MPSTLKTRRNLWDAMSVEYECRRMLDQYDNIPPKWKDFLETMIKVHEHRETLGMSQAQLKYFEDLLQRYPLKLERPRPSLW